MSLEVIKTFPNKTAKTKHRRKIGTCDYLKIKSIFLRKPLIMLMIDSRLGKLFPTSKDNIGLILNVKETPAGQGEKIRKK